MASSALTAEDRALLERISRRVVELRLEVPALLTLETARPLSLLAGQSMVFFEPLVQALFRLPDYHRFAALIERRDALEVLAETIERDAEARRRPPPRGAAGKDGVAGDR